MTTVAKSESFCSEDDRRYAISSRLSTTSCRSIQIARAVRAAGVVVGLSSTIGCKIVIIDRDIVHFFVVNADLEFSLLLHIHSESTTRLQVPFTCRDNNKHNGRGCYSAASGMAVIMSAIDIPAYSSRDVPVL